jgi:hypothetical protein
MCAGARRSGHMAVISANSQSSSQPSDYLILVSAGAFVTLMGFAACFCVARRMKRCQVVAGRHKTVAG